MKSNLNTGGTNYRKKMESKAHVLFVRKIKQKKCLVSFSFPMYITEKKKVNNELSPLILFLIK